MSLSIQEVKNNGGSVIVGPITVKSAFPPKAVKGGKIMKSYIVYDGSGETKLTLWEPASNQDLLVGQTYTLRGKIELNEYNGNVSLQSSDASIGASTGQTPVPGGGSQHASQSQPAGAQGARTGQYASDDARQAMICRQNALTNATVLFTNQAAQINDPYSAAKDIMDVAARFAQFSLTGQIPPME